MSKKNIKILFTSVGRRVELIQAFRDAAERTGIACTVYGTDISESAPALRHCDRTMLVCRISDPRYIDTLIDICQKEQIDALIPTIDTDLLLLSTERARIEATGAKVFISAPDKIALCRDKRFTADYFMRCGLKSPRPTDDIAKYTDGFPCFIKPKDGSSSINAYKIEDREDLIARASSIDDYIIQPFIEGTEYTVDIFCDLDGHPIYITPRERTVVRGGEVLKTKIVQDAIIKAECRKLITDFKPRGALTVQLIREHKSGENYYIEINPRFGGGAPLSMKAGADSAAAAIRLLSGEAVSEVDNAACDGAIYSRFDQSVCTYAGTLRSGHIKAVVFDLDDTLYPEIQYVKSGFRAIGELLPSIENAGKLLFQAFESGVKQPIDTVLTQYGVFSEELKQKCVAAYRNHMPTLTLREGALSLLNDLRRQGLKIGIITDGRPEGQRAKLDALGLYDLVDEIIVTDELGGVRFRKPDDISFRMMKKRLNVAFSEMIYVGDNPNKDFIAPGMLGIRSCFLQSCDGLYCNGESGNVDYTIKKISELAGIINDEQKNLDHFPSHSAVVR